MIESRETIVRKVSRLPLQMRRPLRRLAERSAYKPLQRYSLGVVEGDDELGSTERLVQPGAEAVSRIHSAPSQIA